MTGTRAWIDDNHSGACGRREPQYLAKVAIEGDQGSAFSNRGAKHLFVRCAVELLFADRHHVVPCAAEQLHDAAAQILVKLEPHAAVTGTKGTRAVSAPRRSLPEHLHE